MVLVDTGLQSALEIPEVTAFIHTLHSLLQAVFQGYISRVRSLSWGGFSRSPQTLSTVAPTALPPPPPRKVLQPRLWLLP